MWYEDRKSVSVENGDMQRAIDSLREELEAVNAYNQRADACADEQLRKILLHNAHEEKEHAAMLLEWMQQRDAELSKELKEYLFAGKEDVAGHEAEKH